MKIILSLALIAVGIYGLFLEYKRRSKEKKEIMERLVANHLIAKNALVRLLSEEKMKQEDFFDSMEHLTENTIDIVVRVCGTKYVEESDWLMKEYGKKNNNTNINEAKVESGKVVISKKEWRPKLGESCYSVEMYADALLYHVTTFDIEEESDLDFYERGTLFATEPEAQVLCDKLNDAIKTIRKEINE